MKIPIADITISDRQRIDLGNIDELADSLAENGQIQAICVEPSDGKYRLIAGRRRLAAATRLGWTHIEATTQEYDNDLQRQCAEFEEDIRRKDRTWQEKCLTLSKLWSLKSVESMKDGLDWTLRKMSGLTGFDQCTVGYMLDIARHLKREPRSDIWLSGSFEDAIRFTVKEKVKEATAELERRRTGQATIQMTRQQVAAASKASEPALTLGQGDQPKVLSLSDRAQLFNRSFPQLLPLVVNFVDGKPFLYGFWFVSGGNVSDYYGAYQVEYLKRIETLFPDKTSIVHIFSGSLPPSDKYLRVGKDFTGKHKSDLEIDVHELSSHIPFKPDLIFADPPYSQEDSEHYKCAMVNRPRVVSECAASLSPGGFLVWIDQALPIFSNEEIRFVGLIAYIRSTGNRFRCVCLFQKPL